MPRLNAAGLPRCNACVETGTRCTKRARPKCGPCVTHDRDCVYDIPEDIQRPPTPQAPSPSREATPRSRQPSNAPSENRRPSRAPSHPARAQSQRRELSRAPSVDRGRSRAPTRSASTASVLGQRSRDVRSPDDAELQEHANRAARLQRLADEAKEDLELARRRRRNREPEGAEDDEPREQSHRPGSSAPSKGKNKARNPSGSDSDEAMVPGLMASGSHLPMPDHAIDVMKGGWVFHLSLVFLTNLACRMAYNNRVLDSGSARDGRKSLSLSAVDANTAKRAETDLSFAEWTQAWTRMLTLIDTYKPALWERWEAHYKLVYGQDDIHDHWDLWLRYDIRMRMLTRTQRNVDTTVINQDVLNQVERDLIHELATARPQIAPAPSTRPSPAWPAAPSKSSSDRPRPQGPSNRPSGSTKNTSAGPTAGPSSSPAPMADTGCSMAKLSATETMPRLAPASVPDAASRSTPAPSAARAVMEPNNAGSDPRRVITPLLPLAWQAELTSLGLTEEFGDVTPGLIYGFPIGASRSLTFSSTPPNHKSATAPDRLSVVREAIDKELAAGRYSGPFKREELEARIGFFRTAPLGVVEKSTPGEFRIIQDFSYPRGQGEHLALNDEIDPNDYPCEWGFFDDVAKVVVTAPPGTQAATFDVDAAYRRMPVRPEDQNHIVVYWGGEFFVDHCVPFGAASSNGIFGRCGDAIARIYSRRGMGPVLKWVDDFLFFRFANSSGCFLYDEQAIIELANTLGWPWKPSKIKFFASLFTYLGFEWDIPSRTVSIPPAKRQKYVDRLQNWAEASRVSLHETEVLVGSLIHCTQVIQEGRPRLAGLTSFSASFNHNHSQRFITKPPSKRAAADVSWWLARLRQDTCTRALRTPYPAHPTECFMDASTSWGIGIVVEGHVAAWKLQPNWRKPGADIGWAEMVAVELALTAIIASGLRDRSVAFRSDNLGVVYAVKSGRSRNEAQNIALMRILEQADSHGIDIQIEYIASADNPADQPSRGSIPKHLPHIHWTIQIPPAIQPLLQRAPCQ
ncbi:Reverse transcriptase domain protein [Ceratobasidium sp. AG-Ba]|nr:Reverse transcriptase domain protein [Ceratobasidium sp. AG-Ba]